MVARRDLRGTLRVAARAKVIFPVSFFYGRIGRARGRAPLYYTYTFWVRLTTADTSAKTSTVLAV